MDITNKEKYATPCWSKDIVRSLYCRTPFLRHFLISLQPAWQRYTTRIHLQETQIKLYRMQESGVQNPARSTPRLVVSLSSHPPRIRQAYAAIYTLLMQSLKPDIVVLWLAEEEFRYKEYDLPDELLHLCQFGLTIRWCENLQSRKKVIPSLREYPEDIVVVADDDMLYSPDWLEGLFAAYKKRPSCIHARTVYRSFFKREFHHWIRHGPFLEFKKDAPPSLLYVPLTSCGILYPPHALHTDVFRMDIAMKIAPYDEETWCWVMAVLKGTRIHALVEGWKALKQLYLSNPISRSPMGLFIRQSTAVVNAYPQVHDLLAEEERTHPETPFLDPREEKR
ncbi:MAG: glycosyltransferase family 2 protein [Holosporales bacterium]|jgi:hypothetical protein|nr:glycosyltransferase family 2 protein [Holosporales bacterium]